MFVPRVDSVIIYIYIYMQLVALVFYGVVVVVTTGAGVVDEQACGGISGELRRVTGTEGRTL